MWQIRAVTFVPSTSGIRHLGNAHSFPEVAKSRLTVAGVGSLKYPPTGFGNWQAAANSLAAPSRSLGPHQFLAESSRMPWLPARSDQERPDPQLRRHQPHQTPGERFLERPPGELVPFRGIQRHHPAGVIDVPPVITATRVDRAAKCILEGATISGGIDAGYPHGVMSHRARGTRRVI